MKPVLFIGYQAFVLPNTAHLQTVLKVLGEAVLLKYAEDGKGSILRINGKACYQVDEEHQRAASVEMVSDKRILPANWSPAIEPEVIEEENEVEIDLTDGRTRRRPRRKALPPASKEIDFRKEFEQLKNFDQPAGQLLLGEGGP